MNVTNLGPLTVSEARSILNCTARTTMSEVQKNYDAIVFEFNAGPSDRIDYKSMGYADEALLILRNKQPLVAPKPSPYWVRTVNLKRRR